MSVKIRDAVAADRVKIRPLQQEIAELHHAGRSDLFRTEGRFFSEKAFRERLCDPDHFVFIAEDGGEVIGYAFAWVIAYRGHSTYIDFDRFYIDDLCVRSTHRRRGIAKQLFERCRETALARGCRTIDLGVWSFNRDAIAFYESVGMKERTKQMEMVL